MNSFPYLTGEEVVEITTGLAATERLGGAAALERFRAEGAEIQQFVDESMRELERWGAEGGPARLGARILATIRKARHFERLRRGWKRLESLTHRMREEYELVLEAFAPGLFDNKQRYLGEEDGGEFMLPEVVRPFLGKAWELDSFVVSVPAEAGEAEFEVSDPDGRVAHTCRLSPMEEIKIPFSTLGMAGGGLWSWCLSYKADGEFAAIRGKVSVVSEEDRSRIVRLLKFAEKEASDSTGLLMKALVLMEFECYDGAIRSLKEGLAVAEENDLRRELLLLLHRTYSKVRESYLAMGLESEANLALRAVFGVESSMESLSEVSVEEEVGEFEEDET